MATRQEIKQYPTRTNQIPRHIPPPHWASHPFVLFLAAGLLPFGTIFVELYFAMTSIWQVRCCRGCLPSVERSLLGSWCFQPFSKFPWHLMSGLRWSKLHLQHHCMHCLAATAHLLGKGQTDGLDAVAQGYFYYIFGFLFLVGILTVIITIEVSIVCTYVQLCAEDYLWW